MQDMATNTPVAIEYNLTSSISNVEQYHNTVISI